MIFGADSLKGQIENVTWDMFVTGFQKYRIAFYITLILNNCYVIFCRVSQTL